MKLLRQAASSLHLYRAARWVQLHTVGRESLAVQRKNAAFYGSLVKPGELVFDVGANRGDISDALIQVGARVVAFEPQPDMCQTIRDRIGGSADLQIRECVLGAEPGEVKLFVNKNHTGQSSVLEEWPTEISQAIPVPMSTLDREIETFGRPSYIKIDVEGYEHEVLKGLRSHVPLVSFEHTRDNEKGAEKVRACIDHLRSLGRSLEVNLTPAEDLTFTYPRWLSAEEFLEIYPSKLVGVEYRYGDVFVRSRPIA